MIKKKSILKDALREISLNKKKFISLLLIIVIVKAAEIMITNIIEVFTTFVSICIFFANSSVVLSFVFYLIFYNYHPLLFRSEPKNNCGIYPRYQLFLVYIKTIGKVK